MEFHYYLNLLKNNLLKILWMKDINESTGVENNKINVFLI
jgi:hypothetical protein